MATFVGFDDLGRRLDAMARDLSAKGMESRLARVGRELAPLIDRAVAGDIGDQSMSGWRRRKPIEVVGTSSVRDGLLSVEPVKAAKGPMRVLESGRNQGNASGFAGPGVNRLTGETARTKSGAVRKVRARKAKRWNGYTTGKGTWSEAAEAIIAKAPGAINDEKVAVMARHFRG